MKRFMFNQINAMEAFKPSHPCKTVHANKPSVFFFFFRRPSCQQTSINVGTDKRLDNLSVFARSGLQEQNVIKVCEF